MTIQVIKRIMGLVLVLIYLSACTQLAGQPNVPLETSPAATLAQTVTPAPLEMPSSVVTSSLVSTPPSSPGTNSVTPQPTGTALVQYANVTLGTCQPSRVTQPPWPVTTLRPNELDQETGLHMTGIAQRIDLASYRLKVTGLVDHPLSLSYDELRCMPNVTNNPILSCPGVFKDYATWTGVPIKYILKLAGVQQGATKLILVSADGYEVQLSLEIASADKNFLAYDVNGKPLPVQHGFPLRAVFPSMWGSYWLKWLVEIRIS